MKDAFYFGLAGSVETYDIKRIVEVSLLQLDSILRTGGIYSKHLLEEQNIDCYTSKPVYNGEHYISISDKNLDDEELLELNDGLYSSYEAYSKNKISILIDKSIINTCEFRTGNYKKMPGERQVKDKIDLSYFVGIMVDLENNELRQRVSEMVQEILDKYSLSLPIINSYDNSFEVHI